MIKKVAAVVAVGGFVSLVFSINRILHKGMDTLDETNKTLAEVRKSIRSLTIETKQTIHTANQITKDVRDKIDAVDPLLDSLHDVGDIIHNATHALKTSSEPAEPNVYLKLPETNQKVSVKIGERTLKT
ncbi:DUF948 domain-containing protein [Paenibacillus psychroresistens]|nr:DUF948 domain-containing protein [Paenibacillus psychroresistens]